MVFQRRDLVLFPVKASNSQALAWIVEGLPRDYNHKKGPTATTLLRSRFPQTKGILMEKGEKCVRIYTKF